MYKNVKITDLIPHRPPFLWVDSILEHKDSSILTEKKIADDLDVFQGHYPQHPILPGVLLCEALFQTGALLVSLLLKDGDTLASGVPVITRIENTKFKRPVGPGDIIRMHVTLKETFSGVWFLKGILRVKEKVAVKSNFCCTLVSMT
ncbi:MAG: beta-hydroxyacyl-ACP dehydratase [Desulfocapsa sp.]|nr:MAG: beta-hydroxyacyl-ACP dehydratase [Desulfocapsa sp.]